MRSRHSEAATARTLSAIGSGDVSKAREAPASRVCSSASATSGPADFSLSSVRRIPVKSSCAHVAGCFSSVLSRYKHLGEEQVRECIGDYGQVVYDLLHNKAPPAKPSTEEEEQDATEKERKRLEEARLRAEIETLEWQSSEDYKGKEAKRMRNLKKKKEKLQKMVYDNQGCVSSGDLLANWSRRQ